MPGMNAYIVPAHIYGTFLRGYILLPLWQAVRKIYRPHFAGRWVFRFMGCTDSETSMAGGSFVIFSCTPDHRFITLCRLATADRLFFRSMGNPVPSCILYLKVKNCK